ARAAANGEVFATQCNRSAVDLRESHDIRRRRDALQRAVRIVMAGAGELADFLERAGIDEAVNALANRESAALMMFRESFDTAQALGVRAPTTQLLDLGRPVARRSRSVRVGDGVHRIGGRRYTLTHQD